MKMREFICRNIEFVYQQWVESINGTVVTIKSGYDWIPLKTKEATISENMKESPAGNYTEQKLEFISLYDSDLNTHFMNRALIFRLTTSEGNTIIWGSLLNPVLTSNMKKELGAGKTSFIRKYTEPEL